MTEDEFIAKVKEWHELDPWEEGHFQELHEYLDLTWEEYTALYTKAYLSNSDGAQL